jgi:hypothetical protein
MGMACSSMAVSRHQQSVFLGKHILRGSIKQAYKMEIVAFQ